MLRPMSMRRAGLAFGLSSLVLGCSAEPRVCTLAGIRDFLYVDVGAVVSPVDSVRVCLPDDCFGPVGRAARIRLSEDGRSLEQVPLDAQ